MSSELYRHRRTNRFVRFLRAFFVLVFRRASAQIPPERARSFARGGLGFGGNGRRIGTHIGDRPTVWPSPKATPSYKLCATIIVRFEVAKLFRGFLLQSEVMNGADGLRRFS
jgi:hypothetical protein